MNLNARDNKAKKTKATFPQIQASFPMSDQSEVIEKIKEMAKKEKKWSGH